MGKRNGIEDLKLSTKLRTGLELLLPRKMVEGERDRASMKNTPYRPSHWRMPIGTYKHYSPSGKGNEIKPPVKLGDNDDNPELFLPIY